MTFAAVGVLQGVVGLALERHRLLSHAGTQHIEPLVVLAPNSIKPWYDLINSKLIPLKSAIR